MNMPCKNCITLSICIASIIKKGEIWYNKTLVKTDISSQHSMVSTLQFFQDSVMDMLREKCSIFKDYLPRPRLQEHLTHDEWEKRNEYIFQFFKKYYPFYVNVDPEDELYKSVLIKMGQKP